MSTFAEIQDRINTDYINRTGFAAQTKRAIQASVRHYEMRRTHFNETATTLASSNGQAYVVFPTNLLILDDFRITISSQDLPLTKRPMQWIRDANVSRAKGQPSDYSIYQGRAQLHLIPDFAYVFPTKYVKQFNTLSADTDTNPWITGAWEEVITYRAAKLMWANILRNDVEASKFASLENDALMTATMYLEQYQSASITPTSF